MDRKTRHGIEMLARGGFAAKGIVYLIFGYLGVQAAFGAGKAGSTQAALLEVLRAPFGRALLAVLAIGLVWYAVWRFLEAFADANDKGNEPKGLARRAGYFASGAVYSAMAFDAMSLVLRFQSDGGGEARSLLAPLLTGWLAVLAGIVVLGYGCYQIWKGFQGKLGKQLKEGEARRDAGPWVITVSRIGLAGRGLLFAAMGYWLIAHPSAGPSMASNSTAGGGLRLLARLPQGELVMALGAAALMAYGVFQLVHARYRRINVPA